MDEKVKEALRVKTGKVLESTRRHLVAAAGTSAPSTGISDLLALTGILPALLRGELGQYLSELKAIDQNAKTVVDDIKAKAEKVGQPLTPEQAEKLEQFLRDQASISTVCRRMLKYIGDSDDKNPEGGGRCG